MSTLTDLLAAAVAEGAVPGAAALVARGGDVEIAAAGDVRPDSIFRVASITKPITAAAVMLLVEQGLMRLDDPIGRWLPELASPNVVRTPASPLDDVVPSARAITVEDILTFRAGWGFPSDFSLPVVSELLERLPPLGARLTPDAWLSTLAELPLLHQPGEAWLYNTCSDVQGMLVARASGTPFDEFLAERVFEPLGMVDTGFHVPSAALDRLPVARNADLTPIEDDFWREPPLYCSGAGGLVSTLADWHRFGRMLLAGGDGILSRRSGQLMMTDHLSAEQRQASALFLEGAGWGYGGSVRADGRYGWVGGSGTTAHVAPSSGIVAVLLTQVQMPGPASTPLMREFWQYAFGPA
jgi:CubicO group peptidase (beta-lactamase class C family)